MGTVRIGHHINEILYSVDAVKRSFGLYLGCATPPKATSRRTKPIKGEILII